jgi:hypothetical protein
MKLVAGKCAGLKYFCAIFFVISTFFGISIVTLGTTYTSVLTLLITAASTTIFSPAAQVAAVLNVGTS